MHLQTSTQFRCVLFTLKFQKGLTKSPDTAENRLLLSLLLSFLSGLSFVPQGSAARSPFRACRTGMTLSFVCQVKPLFL